MIKYKKIIITIILIIIVCILLCIGINNKYKKEKIDRYNKNKEAIVFLGDSLTSRYDLDKYYPNYNVHNSGVSGNMTTDILNDLDNRVYKYNPTIVILLIGTNDLVYSNLDNDGISNNIKEIVNKIYDNNSVKIYVESVYPVNTSVNKEIVETRTNESIKNLNSKIKKICTKKCTYINIYDSLLDRNGNLKRIYTVDGLHLNSIGYKVVTKELKKYLDN